METAMNQKIFWGIAILVVFGAAIGIAQWDTDSVPQASLLSSVSVQDFLFSSSTSFTGISRTLVTESPHVLAQGGQLTVFKPLSPDGWLWTYVHDAETGRTSEIHTSVSSATINPAKKEVMITTGAGQLMLVGPDGSMKWDLNFSTEYADSVLYSPNGSKIAYVKVEVSDPYNPEISSTLGIAVLDISTGIEIFILPESEGEDIYGVSGWAPDGSRVFYESTRNDALPNSEVWATWSVRPDGTEPRQETNTTVPGGKNTWMPQFGRNLLWDTNSHRLFSELDGEIWAYKFDRNWHVVSGKKVANGRFLQWSTQGKRIVFREPAGDRIGFWKTMDISNTATGGVE